MVLNENGENQWSSEIFWCFVLKKMVNEMGPTIPTMQLFLYLDPQCLISSLLFQTLLPVSNRFSNKNV